MHRTRDLALLTLALICSARCEDEAQPAANHLWFQVRDHVQSEPNPADLDRGVIACKFNDLESCERYLKRPLLSGSKAEQITAHEALMGLYMSLGRARMALPHASAVNKLQELPPAENFETGFAAYSQFHDMSVAARQPTTLPCDRRKGHYEVPVTINGRPGIYMLDTGAGFSMMGETEARRLGLQVISTTGQSQVLSLGGPSHIKIAVADRVELGAIFLQYVPFVILSDADVESLFPPRGGALGIQVLLACRTFEWRTGDTVRLGFPSSARRERLRSNLCIDNGILRVQTEFDGRALDFAMDTGGERSLLFEPFAKEFPALIGKTGVAGSIAVTATGNTRKPFSTTSLPEVELAIGNARLTIRPAQIIQSPGKWGHGLLGTDVFQDAKSLTLDFQAMMVTVE